MKKQLLLLVALCLSVMSTAAVAQTKSELDSCQSFIDSGKYKQGIKRCSELIAKFPKNAQLFYYRATCRKYGGAMSEALPDYTRSLELEPGDLSALIGRGDCYRLLKQPQKAIADANKAIEVAPADAAAAFCNRGEAEVDLKLWDAAISDLSRTIKQLPDSGEAHYYRGLAYKGKGDKEKSTADLNKAKELGYKIGTEEWNMGDRVKPAAEAN